MKCPDDNMMIAPNPGILDMPLYVGGKSSIAGVHNIIKLSSNENPHGPSPAVQAFLQSQDHALHRYPDGGCTDLRNAIGSLHSIDPDRIVCSAGSDELIGLLCKAYCAVGDEVIYSQHGFLMYKLSALAVGSVPIVARETDLTTDVDALLDCVTDKTKIVFIANPNNPTGTYIKTAEVHRLVKGLPKHVILVLDSAYCEYVADGVDCTDGKDMVDQYDNVIMLRTFSKIYGIAGLRLGWMYASKDICGVINRVRGPFNVSTLAQTAGKVAVEDQDFIAQCRTEAIALRSHMSKSLTDLGFYNVPSQGNFILIRFDGTPCSADVADEALKKNGLIVRRMESYGLDNSLRITVGRPQEVERVIAIFKDVSA